MNVRVIASTMLILLTACESKPPKKLPPMSLAQIPDLNAVLRSETGKGVEQESAQATQFRVLQSQLIKGLPPRLSQIVKSRFDPKFVDTKDNRIIRAQCQAFQDVALSLEHLSELTLYPCLVSKLVQEKDGLVQVMSDVESSELLTQQKTDVFRAFHIRVGSPVAAKAKSLDGNRKIASVTSSEEVIDQLYLKISRMHREDSPEVYEAVLYTCTPGLGGSVPTRVQKIVLNRNEKLMQIWSRDQQLTLPQVETLSVFRGSIEERADNHFSWKSDVPRRLQVMQTTWGAKDKAPLRRTWQMDMIPYGDKMVITKHLYEGEPEYNKQRYTKAIGTGLTFQDYGIFQLASQIQYKNGRKDTVGNQVQSRPPPYVFLDSGDFYSDVSDLKLSFDKQPEFAPFPDLSQASFDCKQAKPDSIHLIDLDQPVVQKAIHQCPQFSVNPTLCD